MENIVIREYTSSDVNKMVEIWNEVVEEGVAFPQTEKLTAEEGTEFFRAQSYCAVAENTDTRSIEGLYILHPNNVGRCGHISNASYAVSSGLRGKHIGEGLVSDCIKKAGELGFKLLQFNAVVAANIHARHLYERLGFNLVGIIPKGFLLKNGSYEDICVYYIEV